MERPEYTPGTAEYLKRVTAEAAKVKAQYGAQPKKGPRGGRYTEATTKEGRPYRRYF